MLKISQVKLQVKTRTA